MSMNSALMTGNVPTGDKLVDALRDGGIVVTANQRLARWYQQCYAASMLASETLAWESPVIVSFETWLLTLYNDLFVAGVVDRYPLSADTERLLWEQVIDGALASDPQAGLISGAATGRTVAAAFRIANDYCWADDVALKTPDHQRYASWVRLFEQACDRLGVISTASVQAIVREHLSSSAMTLPPMVMMAGFLSISPQQHLLLDALVAVGVAVDQAPDFSPQRQSTVERVGYRDEHDELYAVAAEVRQSLEQRTDAGGADPDTRALGVVIPDLANRRADVLRAFDAVFFPGASPDEVAKEGRPYDLSLGESLRHVPSVDAALLVLEFAFAGLHESNDLSRLIASRYLADADTERDSRSAFDLRRRSQAIRSLTIESLPALERVPSGLSRIARRLQKKTPTKAALPSEWFRRVVNVLDIAGWPGESAPDSIEFQAITLFRDMLEGLSQYDLLLGDISVTTMLQLLNDMAASRVFQQEVGTTPVQVLGALESQGLDFQTLWVMGMDMESWPGRSRANPFLPVAWQRERQVPGASVETDRRYAEVLTQWWQRSAQHVIFTWPRRVKSLDVDASALIADVHERQESDEPEALTGAVAQRVYSAVSTETLPDHFGPAVETGATVRGGARLFEDQASCPFRSFVTHRLRARAVEEPVMGIDARERGNAFHLAMQLFWEQVKTQDALTLMTVDDVRALISELVDQAMETVHHESDALQALEASRNKAMMFEWITQHEWARPPFTVVETEAEQTVVLNDIAVTLKVDRVDELDGEGRLIIDYKTGKNNTTKSWNEERIVSAQLPLYAALNDEVIGVCFAQVARNRQGFIGLAQDGVELTGVRQPPEEQSWPQQVQRWTDRLSLLASEIKQGVASVTPVPGACTYCDLKPVCRIDAMRSLAEEEANVEDTLGDAS